MGSIIVIIIIIFAVYLFNKIGDNIREQSDIKSKEDRFRLFVAEVFWNSVNRAHRQNPLKDSPMEGYALLQAHSNAYKHLMNDIPSLSSKFYLPQETVRRLIEEVSKDIHDKVFVN